MTLENIDLDNLLRQEHLENPCTVYRQLQKTDAVHWNPNLNGWMISRYDDVRDLLQDARLSSATPFGYIFKRELTEEEKSAVDYIRPYVEMSLLNMDPPDQTRQRSLLGPAFTVRRLEQLRGRIQQIVDEMLDVVLPTGKVELIHQFAYPLLFDVVFELIGIPQEIHIEARRLFQEGSSLIIKINSSGNPATEHLLQFADNLRATEELLKPVIEERRKHPKRDTLSVMVEAEKRGELSEKEIYVLCAQLVFAAHETTANVVGNGTLALLRNPEQLEQLKTNRELLNLAVEEILRYAAPGQMRPRIALESMEIRGHQIQKGQRVFVMLAAANYDGEHFPDPEQLNIGRPKNEHIMTFGHGIHFCLGAGLARIELQVILSTLLRRLPGLRLAPGTIEWRPNFLLRGLTALPLEFDIPATVLDER